MSDRAIPILPFRSLPRLVRFYESLGFKVAGPGAAPNAYVIATLGALEIHFCRRRGARAGMAYLRTGSVERLHKVFSNARLASKGTARVSAPEDKPWGMREFSVVDAEGNLLRIGQFSRPGPGKVRGRSGSPR